MTNDVKWTLCDQIRIEETIKLEELGVVRMLLFDFVNFHVAEGLKSVSYTHLTLPTKA